MNIQNVVIAGGGVLGSQIAYQSAYKGFSVTIWLRSEASIGRSRPKLEHLHSTYLSTLEALKPLCGSSSQQYPHGLVDSLEDLTEEKIEELKQKATAAYDGLVLTTDLEAALKDADLVIESVAEDPQAKASFYTQAAPLMPEKTILATNSSTMLPSSFAKYTGRPEKYLAIHFANEIWKNNTAEIMRHDGTGDEAYDTAVDYARKLGMVPLCLKKEQPGYILNSLLIPLLNAAQALYVNGVSDPETIDLTWKMGTGAPAGPFQILDIVGLNTAYNIVMMSPDAGNPDTTAGKIAAVLKEHIDAGKTGVNAGEGFYKYN